VRLVEQHALGTTVRAQHGREERAIAAADIDDRARSKTALSSGRVER
jgi:hypothetical protein